MYMFMKIYPGNFGKKFTNRMNCRGLHDQFGSPNKSSKERSEVFAGEGGIQAARKALK
jgi:hypothetical protein